jgi:hypothetical protein
VPKTPPFAFATPSTSMEVLAGLRWKARIPSEDASFIVLQSAPNSGSGLSRGARFDILYSPEPRLLSRFGGLWCEYAFHSGIHFQLRCVTKRILSRLSFRQLVRLIGVRICLLFQLVRRQKYDLLPVTGRGHFNSIEIAKS